MRKTNFTECFFFQPLSDRHHPFDVRREFVPPDFRGGWSRDMRGREGYDGYDGRGIPGDYERHYERDRPHHDRGIVCDDYLSMICIIQEKSI